MAKKSRRPRRAVRGERPPPAALYARLRDLIVEGRLAPGSRIIETDIAERLGVSRTPAREALQRLEQEGYVISAPLKHQSRLTVAPLTRADVSELLGIVGLLEGFATRAAANLPAADRQSLCRDLKTMNAEFRRAAEGPASDHNRVFELDERFHRRLMAAGAGSRLLAIHDAVKPQAERYIRMYISNLVGDIRPSVDEHEAIIRAVRKGFARKAQQAVQTNWLNAAERLSKVIEYAGERGSW